MILTFFVFILVLSLYTHFAVKPDQKSCVKHKWTMKRKDGTIEDYLVCSNCGQTPEDILRD